MTVSIVLRMLFCLSSYAGIILIVARKGRVVVTHALILGGLTCLMASGCLADGSMLRIYTSISMLLILALCDCAFLSKADAYPHVFILPALLSGVGVTIMFDVAPESVANHFAFVMTGVVGSVAMFAVSRGHAERIASLRSLLFLFSMLLCVLPLVSGLGLSELGLADLVQFANIVLMPSNLVEVIFVVALSGFFTTDALNQSGHDTAVYALLIWRSL